MIKDSGSPSSSIINTALELPAASQNPDWDPLVLQPDPNLPDDGIYDALALTDAAGLNHPFRVNFLWSAEGSPGSQPFEIYGPGFDTIDNGHTTPLPEPGLLLLGATAALLLRRKD